MLTYPEIDPVALGLGTYEIFGKTIGPIDIHWYGLMYLFGFTGAWLLGMRRTARPGCPVRKEQVEDLIFYGAMGVVLGARVGYVFLYDFSSFLENPSMLLRMWEGGMSFHGGLIGVLIAMKLYANKINKSFIDVMDFVAPLVPIGLGLGRLGNFIGGELWGRQTDVAWGMIFPKDPEQLVRHPSQLYQSFFEGLVLFIILNWYASKPRPKYTTASLFLIGYGTFRFGVEFVREPDAHIGYMFGWMTRGQLLSLPMIIIGAIIFFYAHQYAKGQQAEPQASKS